MNQLSLNIKTLKGEKYNVNIDKNKKIIDIKNELSKQIKNKDISELRLIHCGRLLLNEESIKLLENNTCIHLVFVKPSTEPLNNDHHTVTEPLDETTDDEDYDDETTDDEYDEPYLLEVLYQRFNPNRIKKRFGGFIPISVYCKSIDEILYFKKNRIINHNHIKILMSNFNIKLMDAIKLGYYDDRLYVVNGQHRHHILLNNINVFNKPGVDILIDVTICRTKSELEKIINTSNNSRSFDSSELNEFKMDKIKKMMNEKYGRELFRKNFPYIKLSKFELKLQKMKFYSENSVQRIVNQLLEINNLIKQRYLIGNLSEDYDKKRIKQFKKHKWFVDKHFYLGIDKKMKWMGLIDSI